MGGKCLGEEVGRVLERQLTTFTQLGTVTHNDLISVDFSDPDRKTILAGTHEQKRKLFLSTDNSTVIVKLQGLLGAQGQGSELLPAGAFISMLIPMIVFFSMQRFFVRGLTSGAVKG